MSEAVVTVGIELDKELQVITWRREQLVRAGYDVADATAIAFETCIDLHAAVELRRRGCPSGTAASILL